MNRLIPFIAIFILSCAPDRENAPTSRAVATYSIEQFMNNESVFGGSFSPDNSKVLLTSNKTGIYNLYTLPTEGGGYEPLTQSDSASVLGISYFPDDERILFRMDDNGNEIYHLFVRESSGEITELTPDPGARAVFYGWAHDGNSFFYGYNARDNRNMDVYEMTIENFTSEMIYQNDSSYEFGGISRDKKYMALSKAINTNDSDLFLYQFTDQQLTQVNTSQSQHTPTDFSPDGDALYYLTDDGSEFAYLVRYDILNQSRTDVFTPDWDVTASYFTHEGTYQVTYINQDARTVLRVTHTEDGEPLSLPSFEDADITNVNFSRDESIMSLYVGGSNQPSNLYTYDIKAEKLTQLTDVLNPEIDHNDLVKAEVVRYESFDGLEVPAIYYLPHQASTDSLVPALVWVHGGPGGQSRQTYNPLVQYLVNHGYAILAVNNRGSSGYGKTFYQMDDQNHGDKDLKDCIAGKEWLAQQPSIHPDQIGIIGGSYGGYMVMAALTFEPEAFEVGVNIFGVTNWIRTLKSIPPWWESFKVALYQEMGDPYSIDSVRLREISPLFHAENVTQPLMVLQGAQDPRVLQAESDEIVSAVRENDVPVEYVLFEDEGHGFVKKQNQIEAYGKILDFLNTYLKQKTPSQSTSS